MNFRFKVILAILLLFFLASCADRAALPTISAAVFPTGTPAVAAPKDTPSPVGRVKPTNIPLFPPTWTRVAPTFGPTPTKTPISSLTPTFDAALIQSVTPAPPAQCPQVRSGVVPTPSFVFAHTFQGPNIYAKENEVLDFLNKYGALGFYSEYQKVDGKNWHGSIQFFGDLTNDGFPELAFGSGFFYIFGCKEGHYITLYKIEPDGYLRSPNIIHVLDANRNGSPEIMLLLGFASQGGHAYRVIEWDGDQFQSLLTPTDGWNADSIFVEATGSLGYEDIDHDGMLEYVANIGIPIWQTYETYIPWREERQVYKWNGKNFVFDRRSFSPPQYRFQAIQDGDRAARAEDYAAALNFYQQTIFSDKLEWWSPDRREYVRTEFFNSFSDERTPIPTPLPNTQEYDQLAAYARYKIMLLHLKRGWVSDAQVVYDTLRKKYPADSPAHIYTALAETVWQEYASSKDLKKACEKAVVFGVEHQKDVTYYLEGQGFPGQHTINYSKEPQWICPFQ